MEKGSYEKIISKKEFSDLPKLDVEKIYGLYSKRQVCEEEKIRLTRDMLRKVYSAFTSSKVLNPKIIEKKSPAEILKKHISTRERFDSYEKIYSLLLKGRETVFDLGAGINGLSFEFFPKGVSYFGVEAVGQMVDLMNAYFSKENLKAEAFKGSLYDLEFISNLINKGRGKKVVFLFKALDSLEMVERNYSKKLLKEIVPLVEKVVVSFATESLVSRKKFSVKRYWFENFVHENFNVTEDFILGGERYICF